MTILSTVAMVVVGWAAVAAGFTLVTLWACVRLARVVAARPKLARFPPLALLRPCEGDEPGLDDNLASSLLAYPGARRVFFLVPSPADPAYAAALRVKALAPEDVEVLITGITSTRNRKVAQLAVGLEAALAQVGPGAIHPAPEIIVQADSDVRFEAETLVDLLSALGDDPKVAAAFAAPVEPHAKTAGDLAASGLLSASHQDFFAIAALAALSNASPSLAGALVAHRTLPLVESGGFLPLEGLLGEDYEVGRRLRERGYQLAIARLPISAPDQGRSLAAVLSRTARWLMVVRKQRPGLLWSYPLLFAPTPLLLVIAIALACCQSFIPLGATILLLCLRGILGQTLRRIHSLKVGFLRALQLSFYAELLMLGATAKALLSRHVVWRGRRLRIAKGGAIID